MKSLEVFTEIAKDTGQPLPNQIQHLFIIRMVKISPHLRVCVIVNLQTLKILDMRLFDAHPETGIALVTQVKSMLIDNKFPANSAVLLQSNTVLATQVV